MARREDHNAVMRVKCEQCGWVCNPDPPYIFHIKTFTVRSEQGVESQQTLWLCPDCSAEFSSDGARNRFLKERLKARSTR